MQNTDFKISVTKAVRTFSELVNCVYYKKNRYLLVKGNKTVASLEPLTASPEFKVSDFLELLKSLPHLKDQEAKSFQRDLKKAKKGLKSPHNPWAI
ncbi:MAG: hypothetical protein HYU97_04870 [Deltaproteobacteria bacterium]|nr:hypothetical protein [Deltaproteobacteria bacterium]